MRKFAATIAVILLLPLLSACPSNDAGVCEPGVVRQDHQEPTMWWVCNQDGTREDRITGPGIPDSSNNG